MKKKFLSRDAFTLIELLTVVAILGIIILIAVPKFLGYTEKAKIAHIKNDVKVAEVIMSEYSMNKKGFPDEWPDVSVAKLRDIASNSKLYDVTGYTSEVPDGNYKEIDINYLKTHMKTHLGGKFYVNEDAKVFYENKKPSKIEQKEDLFDREVEETVVDSDEINVLGYNFPNGIYRNGETMLGEVEVKGIKSGNYFIEFQYIHSKFGNKLNDSVEFNLKEGQVKTIDFDFLVKSSHLRGFYDFELIIKNSSDKILANYNVKQSVYFADAEWIYYYKDDFNEVNKPIAGQIGSLSPDRVTYDYIYDNSTGIDYSSIKFDVQPNSNESGQVRTILPETYGSYEAMIKVPESDALLNGFFLYGHNEKHSEVEHEIDIEIVYYEGKWQVWGTVYNETHKDYVYNGIEPGVIYHAKLDLDFDPSSSFNSYRIDFYDDYISFAVNGREFGRWENRFDYGDMHLYMGNFYTHWLSQEISDEELEMDVKWARKGYFK